MKGRGKGRGSANTRSHSLSQTPDSFSQLSSNTQPSSTAQYPCVTCKQNVSDNSEAIMCDRCGQWLHIKQACSGLPKKLASELLNFMDSSIEYVCNICRTKPNDNSITLKSLFNCINQLSLTVQGLASGVGDMKSRMSQFEDWKAQTNHLASVPHSTQALPDTNILRPLIRSELLELREQDKRRDGVVVRGITFSSEEDFLHKFNQICTALLNKTIEASDIAPINSNFIRLKIENRNDRLKLLTSAPKLRGLKDFIHIYISKDLTYQQRTELRNRRQQNRNVAPGSFATGANSTPLNRNILPVSIPTSTLLPPSTSTTTVTSVLPASLQTAVVSQSSSDHHGSPTTNSLSSSFETARNFFTSPANLQPSNNISSSPHLPRNNNSSPNDQEASQLRQTED